MRRAVVRRTCCVDKPCWSRVGFSDFPPGQAVPDVADGYGLLLAQTLEPEPVADLLQLGDEGGLIAFQDAGSENLTVREILLRFGFAVVAVPVPVGVVICSARSLSSAAGCR